MILEAMAVFAGLSVLVVYVLQLNQIFESNRINRDSLESVQRAFMVFKEINETRMRDSKNGRVSWTFKPLYENSGTTPALYAINMFTLGGGQGELPEKEFLAGTGAIPINSDTVGPKATRQGPSFDLDESDIFGVFLSGRFENFGKIRPRGDIYFWGWMAYRDVFRETPIHLTEFCRHMATPQLLATSEPKITFNFENCSPATQLHRRTMLRLQRGNQLRQATNEVMPTPLTATVTNISDNCMQKICY